MVPKDSLYWKYYSMKGKDSLYWKYYSMKGKHSLYWKYYSMKGKDSLYWKYEDTVLKGIVVNLGKGGYLKLRLQSLWYKTMK